MRAKLVDDFDQPVYVTGPRRSGGRLFIVEKQGRIMSIGRHGKPRTFLNIKGRVAGGTEQGLLSVAFAPKYRKNRRFYVYYTEKQHGDIVIAEFRRSRKHPGKAVAKSRRTVIRIQHRMAPNHNGGQLQFGPDGYLYFGTGDGGGGGDPKENAQNKDSLLGKLLRIDPRRRHGKPYTVPSSNPFVGRPGRDEIYSYGLRNPYRFSFDRRGGHLVIGDVGQERWEEIDYLTRKAANGANFGWDAYEGRAPYEVRPIGAHVDPIQVYSHAGGNCSVTGGYVYRGPRAPLPARPLRLRRLLRRPDPQPDPGGTAGSRRPPGRPPRLQRDLELRRGRQGQPLLHRPQGRWGLRDRRRSPVASRAGRSRRRARRPCAARRQV